MSLGDKVIWSEGMFLRPQHFQQHDRYVQNFTEQRVAALRGFPWGITHMELDGALLGAGKVGVVACRGVFPDGTPFDIPEQNGPCPPLVVDEGVKNATVYLAVPLLRPGAVEVASADDAETLARFVRDENRFQDSNANAVSKDPIDIEVAKLRARLLLVRDGEPGGAVPDDPRGDYSFLALARIRERKADDTVVLDEDFIPPSLDCKATILAASFERVLNLLDKRAAELLEKLGEAGRGGASEFYNFLALQVVNRYQPLFAHWVGLKGLHPLDYYEGALQLAGELSTLTSASRRPPEFPRYRHTDLKATFAPVLKFIQDALSKVVPTAADAIPIREDRFGYYVAMIADRNLLTQASFVLAVRADVAADKLRLNFPPQVTIGSPTEIGRLVKSQVQGVDLHELPTAPPQIPFHSGYCYFELDAKSKYWKGMAEEGGIAFHLANELPGLEMTLWAIRG